MLVAAEMQVTELIKKNKTHVEEKEKFFDCAFYPFRIVLSLFVSFSSSSRF